MGRMRKIRERRQAKEVGRIRGEGKNGKWMGKGVKSQTEEKKG